MTEPIGQNSEVLPDPPATQAGAGPPPDIAPIAPQHYPEQQREVMEAAADLEEGKIPQAGNEHEHVVLDTLPESAPEPDVLPVVPEEPVAEVGQARAPGAPGRPNVLPAAEPARRRAESGKSRKAAAISPAPAPDVPKSENMNWYILKVQSNREESIREGLLRRVSIQGLDRYFGEVIVPTEKVTEFKGGKKRVIKRKLYPGYLVVHMEINEDTWFLVRETPGIGDFTGASGVPTPMLPHEVERIIAKQEEKSEKAPDLKIPFAKGDRVKVVEGNFENFEGEVDAIDKTNGRVTVMITIFNRTTPVEFEYWQVESV